MEYNSYFESEEKLKDVKPRYSFKDILFNVSIIYGLLIFLGLYEKKSWFDKFGIAIYDYISLNEILISFLPFINNVFIKLIGIIILHAIISIIVNKIVIKYRIQYNINILFFIKVFLVSLFSCYIFATIWNIKNYDSYSLKIDKLFFIYALINFLVVYGIHLYMELKDIKIIRIHFYTTLSVLFLFIILIHLKTKIQYDNINDGSIQNICFIYKDDTINTANDLHLKFIGNLNNYIILHDTISNNNNIYPTKDIIYLKITGK